MSRVASDFYVCQMIDIIIRFRLRVISACDVVAGDVDAGDVVVGDVVVDDVVAFDVVTGDVMRDVVIV